MNNFNNDPSMENKNPNNLEANSNKNKKPLLIILVIALLIIGSLIAGLLILGNKKNDLSVSDESYKFVNNNSAICSPNSAEMKLECVDVNTNKVSTSKIPSEYENLTYVLPSDDGTKLLLGLNHEMENAKYVVTDINFNNPQEITLPFAKSSDLVSASSIIWGGNSNKLIISKQMREENDADFLPAPLVVWEYDMTTKQSRRIYKNGDNEDISTKIIGASDEFLFISQPIHKNWVALNTDPPADALLAVRLDDGFVRLVSIEQVVRSGDLNRYASVLSMKYNSSNSTFYIIGQNQTTEGESTNFLAAAKLIESDNLELQELSRLTSNSEYAGLLSTKGTLVTNWSEEQTKFKFILVSSENESHDLENFEPNESESLFSVVSLPDTE